MTSFHDFDKLLDETIQHTIRVLSRKGLEYSDGADRLRNFRKAARMQSCTLPQAIRGMYMKHFVSIDDLIDSYAGDPVPMAVLDEKIGDMINYLILLKAALGIDNVKFWDFPEEGE